MTSDWPDLPFRIEPVSPATALDRWQAVSREARSPILLTASALEIAESWFRSNDPAKVIGRSLAQAKEVTFPDTIRARKVAEWATAPEESADPTQSEAAPGDWPATTPTPAATPGFLSIHLGRAEPLYLGQIPSPDPGVVPAWVRFGGFNDCPFPHEHVKALRTWNRAYGAVPVYMSDAALELYVPAPPQTRDAALTVARQFEAFGGSPIDQGATLAEAAAQLMASRWWFFWWD